MGAHESTLISQIGPPDRRVSDGKGGEVLVYERYVDLGQTTGKVYTDRFGDIRYTSPQQRGMNFVRMFYIDGKGYIYFWKTEGR